MVPDKGGGFVSTDVRPHPCDRDVLLPKAPEGPDTGRPAVRQTNILSAHLGMLWEEITYSQRAVGRQLAGVVDDRSDVQAGPSSTFFSSPSSSSFSRVTREFLQERRTRRMEKAFFARPPGKQRRSGYRLERADCHDDRHDVYILM